MERCLPACWDIDDLAKQGDVLCFKRVSSRTEQIERLTVGKEHSFLRFVDNQLRSCVEIFARMLPYESAIVAFIFDNIGYCHSVLLSFYLPHNSRYVVKLRTKYKSAIQSYCAQQDQWKSRNLHWSAFYAIFCKLLSQSLILSRFLIDKHIRKWYNALYVIYIHYITRIMW